VPSHASCTTSSATERVNAYSGREPHGDEPVGRLANQPSHEPRQVGRCPLRRTPLNKVVAVGEAEATHHRPSVTSGQVIPVALDQPREPRVMVFGRVDEKRADPPL